MRSSRVIIVLLLTMTSRCYGNTTDNCTTFPTFISSEGYLPEYSPAYHCYMYPLPPVFYNQPFNMTVNVSEDDVILTWYTHEDGILKCHHYPCDVYVWSADNRTLTWLNPNMSKVFYVNVTNRCGKGNAIACFKVIPLCQTCDDCDELPGPTNNSIKVAEHSDHKFDFTIKGEVFTRMYWSFVRPNNSSLHCYCNADPENKTDTVTECDVPNWTLHYYHNDCYLYTCSLTIRNVSMDYTDGMLISAAASSPHNIKNVSYTRILVTQDSENRKSIPALVYYCVTGVAIVVCVISMGICVTYMMKKRCRWSRSYHTYEGYESIPSPSPFEKTAPVSLNDGFHGDDGEDVRSCDLEIVNTPPKNV